MIPDRLEAVTRLAAGGSRIERVETYVLRPPLRRPLSDSIYDRTHWVVPVVEITTADGLIGTGYSGLWTGEDLVLRAIHEYLVPRLQSADAALIGALWQDAYWSPLHWVGRAGVAHMAQSMVDIALWDLAAQRAGMPLWHLLGGRHPVLETYNTDGGWLNFTVEELIDDMQGMVEAGWSKVKMKVGGPSLRADLARVSAVREALPAHVELMVDVNQRWDRVTALRALRPLAELGIGWLEEPLHPDDVHGHARLARDGSLPIALGESVYSAESFATFLEADAVDVVQVDVTRVAGITEWLRVAHTAQEASRWVVPHAGDMMQVHQHLVAGVGSAREAMVEYLPWGLELFAEPVRVERGKLRLPSTPGASTRIHPEARERFEDRTFAGRARDGAVLR